MRYDVVVIGAGLGGIMAALSSAGKGKRVLLVGRGMGIITIFTGTIDILGYYPHGSAEPLKSPLEGIERIINEDPDHPYTKIGLTYIKDGVSTFVDVAREEGVSYIGGLSDNFLVPTAVGTIKPTSLLSSSMASGDIREPGDVLISGFYGLKDFYPDYMAHNISTASGMGVDLPHFRAKMVDVDIGADSSGISSLTLARKFDKLAYLEGVADAIFNTLRDGERVAMPAVMGLKRFNEVHKRLEELVGAKVFETPTLPPSVPGFRLFSALEGVIRSKSIRFLLGYDVQSPVTEGRRVKEVTLKMGNRETRVSARAFVLATGGIVGRGLYASQSEIAEPIFGLNVSGPETRKDWFRKSFLDPKGHPINRAGIKVDERLRPLDKDGSPVFDNLFVAGAQLMGFDALREKSGGGVAISSGYKAGILASEWGDCYDG